MWRPALLAALAALALSGCNDKEPTDSAGPSWTWDLPDGFPEPVVPDDNPMSAAKVELGRHLFYDVRLSYNETQSCGSCHKQELAFTDGRAAALGSTGEDHRRGSMALANVGYASALTWASDVVRTLEDQAMLPIFGETPVELGMAGHEDELIARFDDDEDYVTRFAESFPDDDEPVSLGNLVKAIAAFERVILSGSSAYDRYRYAYEDDALSPEAERGLELYFSEELECFHCHGGFAFTDSVQSASTVFEELYFHNNALYNLDESGAYPETDQGLYELTGEATDMGRFRAPTLRNIALTAPYMHDGSIATLSEVLDHYAAGGRTTTVDDVESVGSDNPNRSEFVRGFALSEEDRAALLAFLEALTDEDLLSDPDLADPFAE